MSRRTLLASLVLIALEGAFHPGFARPLVTPPGPARVRSGELLVLTSDPARLELRPDGGLRAAEPSLRAALARHGIVRFSALGRADGRGRRALLLKSDQPGFDPRAAAAELSATGAFRAVAPNLLLDLYETVPNDPFFANQWQFKAATNTDGQLTEAWDVWKGDTSTVIAVMDNGFDITDHPDMVPQAWTNWGEIPGNAVDDDGNGWVDDVKGWDFGNGDDDPSAEPNIDISGLDIGFHGTFVAAIAAGATHNGVGIAGAGWKCRFMPLKIADAAGDMTLAAVTEAFSYVVDQAPPVLNMSFGTLDTLGRDFFQALVDDANAANVLCVAAAGNDGVVTKTWPAACTGVLAVGATTQANARATFSNYGPWVDIAAPGAEVFSAICDNYPIDDTSQIFYWLFFWYDLENPYMYGDGTSFASPLVAGVAGLVRSKYPALTASQVAAHLVATGDVVAYDQPIGPRVNALNALGTPLSVEPTVAAGVRLGAPWPNPFTASATIAFSLSEAAPVRLALYDPAGRVVRVLVDATLPPGRHAALWDGRDSDGRGLKSGIYFAALESAGGRAVRKLVLAR